MKKLIRKLMDKDLIIREGLLGGSIMVLSLGQLLVLSPEKELYGIILLGLGILALAFRALLKTKRK